MDLNKANAALKTGEWWSDEWWKAPEYHLDADISHEIVEAAVSFLKTIFDAEWYKEYAQRFLAGKGKVHPLFDAFRAQGHGPFRAWMKIGLDLQTVIEADQLGDFRRRLKDPNQFPGAESEMHFLASFLRTGYRIERNVYFGKGKRNFDFAASFASLPPLSIEVTRISMARSNAERCTEEYQKTIDYISGRSPIRPKGTPLSQDDEIEKILQSIHSKLEQLPESGAGIIVVQHDLPIDENHATKITDSFLVHPEVYVKLSAVALVFSVDTPQGLRPWSHLLLNPNAQYVIRFVGRGSNK